MYETEITLFESEFFLNLPIGVDIKQEPTEVGSCILGHVPCGVPVALLETIQDDADPTYSWHHIRTKNNLRGWFVAEPGENPLLEDDPKPAKSSLTQLARYSSPQRRFINNTPGINVRTVPTGRSCSTLATLPYGQPVEILGESYGKYGDCSKDTGLFSSCPRLM